MITERIFRASRTDSNVRDDESSIQTMSEIFVRPMVAFWSQERGISFAGACLASISRECLRRNELSCSELSCSEIELLRKYNSAYAQSVRVILSDDLFRSRRSKAVPGDPVVRERSLVKIRFVAGEIVKIAGPACISNTRPYETHSYRRR